jgi:hypothetical protein
LSALTTCCVRQGFLIFLPFSSIAIVIVFVAIFCKWKKGIYAFILASFVLFVSFSIPHTTLCNCNLEGCRSLNDPAHTPSDPRCWRWFPFALYCSATPRHYTGTCTASSSTWYRLCATARASCMACWHCCRKRPRPAKERSPRASYLRKLRTDGFVGHDSSRRWDSDPR